MAGLGIDGLISNLDTTSIIESLLELERAPISTIQVRQTNNNNRITALQNLSANLLSLSVAAGRLGSTSAFTSREATSSRTSIVGVTVDSSAAEGTYVVNVQQLARTEQLTGDLNTSSTTALGLTGEILVNGQVVRIKDTDTLTDVAKSINAVSGVNASVVRLADGDYRLSIAAERSGANTVDLRNVGSGTTLQSLGLTTSATSLRNTVTGGFTSSGFIGKSNAVGSLLNLTSSPSGVFAISDGAGKDVFVTVDLAQDSLEEIAEKIQDASDAAGATLTATVTGSSGNYKLQVTSAAGATVVDDTNGVLQTLGVLKLANKNQTADQIGRDALFTVNGVSFTRSSNLVNDAISGVTLSLFDDTQPTVNPQITVRSRTSDISSSIQTIADAYNNTRSLINQVTAYDTETKETGILLGDSIVRSIDADIAALMQTRVSRMLGQNLSGLNSGAGVAPGSIKITNSKGESKTIDLSGAVKVQDVIDKINASGAGVKVSTSTQSAANPDFDPLQAESASNRRFVPRSSLVVTDTAGGNGGVKIEEVSGGRSAEDLGILGSSSNGKLFGKAVSSVSGTISLSDVGLSFTDTGTLTFDSSKLSEQNSLDPAAVQALFSASDVGVADRFGEKLGFITATSRGTIASRIQGLRDTIEADDDAVARIEERVSASEQRLRRQFTTLETTLARLQSTSDYITNQLSNLGNIYQNSRR